MDTDNEIKYLGIDWGASRIGLAVASNISKTAVPLGVVGQLSEILQIISQEEIDEIVVGLPVKMSGQTDNFTAGFEAFVHALQETSKLPVYFTDERLTSVMADHLSPDKKQTAPQDAVAAMLILQTYLDQLP